MHGALTMITADAAITIYCPHHQADASGCNHFDSRDSISIADYPSLNFLIVVLKRVRNCRATTKRRRL